MLKNELIDNISRDTGQSKDAVRQVLDSVRDHIIKATSKGEESFLFGLGKICVSWRPAKTARVIRTGESVVVPPRCVPVLRASTALKEAAKAG